MEFLILADKKAQAEAIFSKIIAKSGEKNAFIHIGTEVAEWVAPYPDTNPKYKVPMLLMTLQIPEVSGWQVIAKLESAPNGSNVIRSTSKEVVPQEFYHGTKCDHCKIDRYRKESYLLLKEDVYYQVGSTCLKEFTGNAFNAVFFKELEGFLKSLDDSFGFSTAGSSSAYSIESVLNVTEKIIAAYGWVSSSSAYESGIESTKNRVSKYLQDNKKVPRVGEVTTDFSEKIEKSLSWIRDMSAESISTNQYLHNLQAACSFGYVDEKNLGLVCSLVSAYNNMIERETQNACTTTSEFVSVVGKRDIFKLTLSKVIDRGENAYGGFSVLYLFDDKDGNAFSWQTTKFLNIEKGATVFIKATVKEHKVYVPARGGQPVNQTVITRGVVQ